MSNTSNHKKEKQSPVLIELQKISKILSLVYSESLEKELSKYATTEKRKKIWVIINGKRMPRNMVDIVGNIKVRAIETYLKDLERAKLIENPPRKPPYKLIDYVPPAWIELFEEIEE